MYRNQYDTDVTVFSPAGRIHQVEYAMEAVKQGSAVVGLRGKDVVILASLKRSQSDLASFQEKIFKVDDHLLIAVSGLTADGRVLRQYMTDECINHKFVYDSNMPVGRLVAQLSDKAQVFTQKADKRPYGVGLLVAGVDKTGAHLYQTDPSGNYYEYIAQAAGARSQTAKTYLEKVYQTFDNESLDALIKHALTALKGTVQDTRLTSKNATLAYVGVGIPLTVLQGDTIKPYIDQVVTEADEVKRPETDPYYMEEDEKKDAHGHGDGGAEGDDADDAAAAEAAARMDTTD